MGRRGNALPGTLSPGVKLQALSTIHDTKVPMAILLHSAFRVALVGVLKGKVYTYGYKLNSRDMSPEKGGCPLRGLAVGKGTSLPLVTFPSPALVEGSEN